MDMNTDGKLDPRELKIIFNEAFDDAEVRAVLEKSLTAADADHDGFIDMEEFRQCLRLGSETNVKSLAQRMHGLTVGADADWIYRENLVGYLEHQVEMYENCKSLPSTLVFFIIFFYLVSSHLNLSTLNKIGTAVRGQISQKQSYMENGFPYSMKDIVHSRLEKGSVAEYNKIIGGVRVSIPFEGAENSAWWKSSPAGPLCDFGKGVFMKELGTTQFQVSINPEKPDVCEEWAKKFDTLDAMAFAGIRCQKYPGGSRWCYRRVACMGWWQCRPFERGFFNEE
jgi:hypothetical protein